MFELYCKHDFQLEWEGKLIVKLEIHFSIFTFFFSVKNVMMKFQKDRSWGIWPDVYFCRTIEPERWGSWICTKKEQWFLPAPTSPLLRKNIAVSSQNYKFFNICSFSYVPLSILKYCKFGSLRQGFISEVIPK